MATIATKNDKENIESPIKEKKIEKKHT
jgi:POLO box duplicated region